MGGSPKKEQLDLLEQKIKFTLRPLINTINTSGMNRERRIQLDTLLLEIFNLCKSIESHLEQQASTESKTRMAGLVDYLYSLTKGLDIQVELPERRQHPRDELSRDEQTPEKTSDTRDIRIVNISLGGMRLYSLAPMKVGSVFRTKLNSLRHGVIPLKGEVIWSRPKQNGEGHIIGVHFLPMDADVVNALKSFLEERDG
jgi:hypothetical protein